MLSKAAATGLHKLTEALARVPLAYLAVGMASVSLVWAVLDLTAHGLQAG